MTLRVEQRVVTIGSATTLNERTASTWLEAPTSKAHVKSVNMIGTSSADGPLFVGFDVYRFNVLTGAVRDRVFMSPRGWLRPGSSTLDDPYNWDGDISCETDQQNYVPTVNLLARNDTGAAVTFNWSVVFEV